MLVVLCGPAYSGKSSLAAALAAFGWTIVSLDEILRANGHEPAGGLPVERWHEAFDVATERVKRALATGATVVVDDTACYRFLRESWRGVAALCAAPSRLVVLVAPEALVRRRRENNVTVPLRPHVVDEVLEPHLASFEWPDESEPALRLDADRPAADLAADVRTYILQAD